MVAVLADGEGARAGGIHPAGAVALAQAQNALGAAEPIQRTLTEQLLDEVATRGADLRRAGATPRRRLHEKVDLVRRQVGREGPPLAGAGAPVRGHEGVVLIQLDLEIGGADPEPLADEPVGPGVVGAGEDDMTVGVELGALPLGQLPRRHRQRLQRRTLHLLEDLQGDLLDRAVHAAASGLDHPAAQMAVAVGEIAKVAASQALRLT